MGFALFLILMVRSMMGRFLLLAFSIKVILLETIFLPCLNLMFKFFGYVCSKIGKY